MIGVVRGLGAGLLFLVFLAWLLRSKRHPMRA